MVCEEQHLCLGAQLAEHLESCHGTIVIELNKQVIDNDRKRTASLNVLLDGRESQGEEQLVARSLAHARDWDARCVRPHSEEYLAIIFIVHHEPRKAAQSDAGKDLGRAMQQRPLVLLPIELYDPVQYRACQPGPGIGARLFRNARR